MNMEILEFLREQTGRVYSVKEISKEVDRDRYERDQTWAGGELKGLCSKGLIEAVNGCYWVPDEEDKKAARAQKEKEESERERIAALSEENTNAENPRPDSE